jgi:hypothetical protein
MIREGMSGVGERARKKGITGGMEERKAHKGRRKGGRPGDRARLGKIQAFPSKFEFAWEKKGGEERWTG